MALAQYSTPRKARGGEQGRGGRARLARLLPIKYEALLLRRDPLLVLDLGLQREGGARGGGVGRRRGAAGANDGRAKKRQRRRNGRALTSAIESLSSTSTVTVLPDSVLTNSWLEPPRSRSARSPAGEAPPSAAPHEGAARSSAAAGRRSSCPGAALAPACKARASPAICRSNSNSGRARLMEQSATKKRKTARQNLPAEAEESDATEEEATRERTKTL